jgi:hypothetical protein
MLKNIGSGLATSEASRAVSRKEGNDHNAIRYYSTTLERSVLATGSQDASL